MRFNVKSNIYLKTTEGKFCCISVKNNTVFYDKSNGTEVYKFSCKVIPNWTVTNQEISGPSIIWNFVGIEDYILLDFSEFNKLKTSLDKIGIKIELCK